MQSFSVSDANAVNEEESGGPRENSSSSIDTKLRLFGLVVSLPDIEAPIVVITSVSPDREFSIVSRVIQIFVSNAI
tara:strand:- start:50 stop:277 length:228 start_codon:yes stop_codon:yes gene_type:complete